MAVVGKRGRPTSSVRDADTGACRPRSRVMSRRAREEAPALSTLLPPPPLSPLFCLRLIARPSLRSMSAEYTDATLAQVRDTIARLQSPIPDLSSLLILLAAPLASLGLLPPRFRKHNVSPISSDALNLARHIPPLQRALLEHVIPTWEPVLVQENSYELVEQYFCPDAMSFAIPAAGQLALYAYSSILSVSMNDYCVRLLAKLCRAYPVDVLYTIVHSRGGSSSRHSVTWEDCVRNVVAVPAKVANYMADRRGVPPELEHGRYFDDVSVRTEHLVHACSTTRSQGKSQKSEHPLLLTFYTQKKYPP